MILPRGWTQTTLGELGLYINGRGFKKSEWGLTGRPIVRIQNLTGSGSSFNYYDGHVDDRHVVRDGDLLVSWAATLGAYVWRGEEALLNQHIFRVESNIDATFHKYLLDYKLQELMRHTHGSGMVHITKGRFDGVPVALPPVEEQRRIVELLESHLSRLDAGAGTLGRVEEQVRLLEQSLIEEHVLHAAAEHGWTSLETWAAHEAGAITDGPFGSNLASRHYQVEGPRVIRLQNIGDGQFRDSNAHISSSHFATLKRHEAKPGDIVLASLGDGLPRAAIVPHGLGPAIVKADCIRVRLQPQVNPEWVLLVMRALRTKRWASSRLHGVGRQRLGLAGIRSIPTPATPPADQAAAVERVTSQMDGAYRLLECSARALDQQTAVRRSILAAAFSGQLSARVPAHN